MAPLHLMLHVGRGLRAEVSKLCCKAPIVAPQMLTLASVWPACMCPTPHVSPMRQIPAHVLAPSVQSSQRRCLINRVAAAAAAGHSGAQVAVLRMGAIGARLKIWWPLDEAWYS